MSDPCVDQAHSTLASHRISHIAQTSLSHRIRVAFFCINDSTSLECTPNRNDSPTSWRRRKLKQALHLAVACASMCRCFVKFVQSSIIDVYASLTRCVFCPGIVCRKRSVLFFLFDAANLGTSVTLSRSNLLGLGLDESLGRDLILQLLEGIG